MSDKRVVLRVEEVKMKDLKKGDKFLMVENEVLMHDGRLMVADEDGMEDENGVGAIQAHII